MIRLELQFDKTMLPCLQSVLRQAQTQEVTQEVRLPEGMPDIGRVVSCWAQPVIRGKEWRSDRIGVNGGVMTWVLYASEEGEPQAVAAWIPYQMKWDIPETRHDGVIMTQSFLRSVDARSLSARKLIVRANVGVVVDAMVPGEAELFTPPELPTDVQICKQNYNMLVPREAGEKAFQMEETLNIPASIPMPEQMIYYTVWPEVKDWKLMTDKMVFRGSVAVHILYRGQDEQVHTWDQEIPFSQYADLDMEYDSDAVAELFPMVTNLELDLLPEGQVSLKAGLSGQYVIYDKPKVEVVTDAYSPTRQVNVQMSELTLPGIQRMENQVLQVEQTMESDALGVMDLAFYPDYPQQISEPSGMQVQIPGIFTLLFRGADATLQSTNAYWEETMDLDIGSSDIAYTVIAPSGKTMATLGSNGVSMQADLLVRTNVENRRGLPMVTALELGEKKEPDPSRPSLILRKAGNNSLWQIAKETGSTVEQIQVANQLTQDPEPDRILLVPVL